MAKTRGGGRVGGSRRNRRNQGLEVEDITLQFASATTLKVKKTTAKKVEDVTPEDDEVEDVTQRHDEVEDVTPEDGCVVEGDKSNDNEAVQAEKAMSEDDKEDTEVDDDEEACLTGHEQKEDEEEAHNMSQGSTSLTKNSRQKCILVDCSNSGRKVVEGRVA
ncbi:hypothetical protein DY000_02058508 [Brassica cretica]|uniref:Histone chaperone domain-containing protein n=1 Tax=Brassica cretica TaxID=69181 RepID=A0ABQ7ANT5_BRACR|nr:hypothetical protein DY000_02058508 [Brassica cretica]